MSKSKSSDLWYLILTPADLQDLAAGDNLEQALLGDSAMEVCHLEPVDADRAQELIELFAELPTGGSCHSASPEGAPCPICPPLQQDLVSSAVRRALRRDS